MAKADLNQLKQRFAANGLPAWARQLILMVGVAASVAIGLSLVLMSREPDYRVLYSSLAPERASAVMDALTAQNIPYKLEDNTGAILVPEKELHNARLKLAGSGLMQSEDGTGLEMIRDEKGFGVSEFMETRKYQHALEVELARTIESIQQVRSARIHLALPKQSVFVRDRKPASASVMVDIQPGSTLEQKNVKAIMNLVSASIPELTPEQVTVVDQQGNLLSRVDRDDALEMSNRQFAYRQQVEKAYEERIERLVSAITPSGQVRVQVSADMDFSQQQESRESFNPDKTVVRSEQITTTASGTAPAKAEGVPGALSNQPPVDATPAPGASDAGATAAAAAGNSAITRNYEIERVLNYSATPGGAIRNLSVAVVVDSAPVKDAAGKIVKAGPGTADLERMTGLVQSAIGFQVERGDKVTVVSAPFTNVDIAGLGEPDEAAFWEQAWFRDLISQVLIGVAVLIVALSVLRPLLRQLLGGGTGGALPEAVPMLAGGPQGDAMMRMGYVGPDGLPAPAHAAPLALPSNQMLEDRMNAVRHAAAEDPRLVAQVVKSWVMPNEQ